VPPALPIIRRFGASVRRSQPRPNGSGDHARANVLLYNDSVSATRPTDPQSEHDESLLDWFLSLTPAERLAELDSRMEFFTLARRDGDPKLPPHPRDS
jgi:hypothetical protein